jgi:hypothetical protein
VADGLILEAVDVTFDIVLRRAGRDTLVASWQHHFDVEGRYKAAELFEATAAGPALDVKTGDLLVFRYTGQSAELEMAYVPNGEGATKKGRVPFIDLPQ